MRNSLRHDIKFRIFYGSKKIEKQILKYSYKRLRLLPNSFLVGLILHSWFTIKGIQSKSDNLIKNISLQSSQPRSVYRLARDSRIDLKSMIEKGFLTGFRKLKK
jgi:ribosomal protein S14